MKRFIAVLLLISGLLCLCSCGTPKEQNTEKDAESAKPQADEEGKTSESKDKENKEEEEHRMKITFLGDSITLGYALENKEEERFSALICKELGAVEDNCGITGTLVARAGLNTSDGKDYVSRLELIKDADISVIFGGTNDYFWSDKPIHAPEGEEKNDAYFEVAVDRICRYIKKNRDVSKTLLVTPYPHNGTGNFLGGELWNTSSTHDTSEKNFNDQTLEDYARVIIEYGEKYGIPVLNLYDTDFDWHSMTVDGCHPNPDGHKWLAEKIGAEIKKMM